MEDTSVPIRREALVGAGSPAAARQSFAALVAVIVTFSVVIILGLGNFREELRTERNTRQNAVAKQQELVQQLRDSLMATSGRITALEKTDKAVHRELTHSRRQIGTLLATLTKLQDQEARTRAALEALKGEQERKEIELGRTFLDRHRDLALQMSVVDDSLWKAVGAIAENVVERDKRNQQFLDGLARSNREFESSIQNTPATAPIAPC